METRRPPLSSAAILDTLRCAGNPLLGVILSLAFVVSACTPACPIPAGEVVPPDIMSTTVDSGTLWGIGMNIVLYFTEEMDPASFSEGPVVLTHLGNPVATTLSYNEEFYACIVNPVPDLLPGETYNLTVGPLVRDVAGNCLGVEHSYTFTTPPP